MSAIAVIFRQRRLQLRVERVIGRVADAEHGRAGLLQPVAELGAVGRKVRREENEVHGQHPLVTALPAANSGAFGRGEEVAAARIASADTGTTAAAGDRHPQSQRRQQKFTDLQSPCNIGGEGWPGSFKPSRRQPWAGLRLAAVLSLQQPAPPAWLGYPAWRFPSIRAPTRGRPSPTASSPATSMPSPA